MPYDPTKPANNAPVSSSELRNQFAGLNDLIDARAPRVDGVNALSYAPDVVFQDPVTADLVAKLNELINALKQP